SSAAGGTSSADIQAYLTAHNSVRAQHGAVPLTWSDTMASKAQQWANGCVFQHSGGTLGPYGENIAAGTGSDYDIAAAIKSWTDEVSQYNPNNPDPSHFTQVVWKATTQLGCAVQTCNGIFPAMFGPAKYFVCEYFVQGNVIGSFRFASRTPRNNFGSTQFV
ncbi:PR-1-like protein, partial [Phlegmacium glaucopus]